MKYVLMVMDPEVRVNQQITLGLARGLQTEGAWHVHVQNRNVPMSHYIELIGELGPKAVVGQYIAPKVVTYLEERSIPVVSVAHKLHNLVITAHDPQYIVNPDEIAIGTTAAEYVLSQGFEHFAYVAYNPANPGPRMKAFANVIRKNRMPLNSYFYQEHPTVEHITFDFAKSEDLQKWLHKLPKPSAIFTHSDKVGAHIVSTSIRTGLRVPDDIAVLGVDDDPLFCRTVMPNLASVRVPYQRLGIEAARIILKQPSKRVVRNVPPSIVAERASCRAPHYSDPLVDKALEYLRLHVEDGVKVSDMQKLTGLTSHQLIYRFHKATGLTPINMILRQRMARAKQLLIETTEPVSAIAGRCGFNNPNRFYLSFRDFVGMSPGDYRDFFEQKVHS